MADVARKRASRARIMMMIYEAAEGSRLNWVSGQWLLDASSLPDEDLGDICQYLESERMIESLRTLWGHATPYQMRLTHRGIKETEDTATAEPSRGDDLDLGLVRATLRLFESAGEAIQLPVEDAKQLAAEMKTVKAQVESPRPNHKSIREHLEIAKALLIGAAGSIAATELLNAINYVLQHH